ncbi:L,D-transpeptidase family protein [Bradyrhizobium sp. STM 3557]|uniref:L,D-transpeptidase n=1 Tax=Bradyrhizobium sp. STM 3557 TaxID=578920 RepID=UPI00388D8314
MLCVRAAARGQFYCAAVVAASLAVGVTSQASAAGYYYWNDSETSFVRPEPFPPRSPKPRHTQDKALKAAAKAAAKEAIKPQGPLIIAVSINKQQLKVYDANGLFTQAPVSSGMKGHPTPMGVFSVIQKQKFHRSNIYSDAPMPFMQRITWSGIALHAGVLPGYPASHGCIRMPPSFAVRMYGLTRIGARVLVTPGEVAPVTFTHPLLAAFKAPTEPSVSVQPEPNAPAAAKTDKGAALVTPTTITELRATIGHDESVEASAQATSLREQTHTADASNPSSGPISDAPAGNTALPADATADAQKTGDVPTKPGTPVPANSNDAKPADGAATADAPKADPAKTADKSADANDTGKERDKDQTRMPDGDKAPAIAKPELKHNSQIAMFISRKDGKLYVRQSLAPVLSVPVTIAASDRPLGTHVFTVAVDKADASALHWSVISLPVHGTTASEDGEKAPRHGKKGAEIEAKAVAVPDSATEALDRITIPADVVAWLGEALSSGSSLIVSDQSIRQGETGEGTEFILSLR